MQDCLSLSSITAFIDEVVRDSPRNRLHFIDDSPIFTQALVGVADGDDPLFQQYKEIIGPFHFTPREALAYDWAGAERQEPPIVRVVSWILPVAPQTRESNAREIRKPSLRWAHTRHYGEQFNNELRNTTVEFLRNHGAAAVAPATSSLFESLRNVPRYAASTWSEWHAAFAAGLGTFGLCDGFLTSVGKAMRCGSVVTDVPLAVTPRHFTSHVEACPYLTRGECGACMHRCPAGAIGPNGHDKEKCERYQEQTLRPLRQQYGVPITGCGLCQTGVPCESGLPIQD